MRQKLCVIVTSLLVLVWLITPVVTARDDAGNVNQGVGTFSLMFDQINSELIPNAEINNSDNIVANLLNILIPWLLILAGLGLFAMLIAGGFQILTSVSSPEGAEAGKKKIGAAFIGFLLLFSSYWLMQILEIIFGFNILSPI